MQKQNMSAEGGSLPAKPGRRGASGGKNVTIYSTPSCHFCYMAKEFFKTNKVAYTEYDVASDIGKRREMMEKSGQMGVPVIYIGDELIIGFHKPKLAKALGFI